MLMGNIWGVWVIVSGLMQCIATEAVFAGYRWKKFTYFTVALAGAVTAVISFFFPEAVTEAYLQYRVPIIIGMLVVRIISGAALGGVLDKAITDGVV